MQAIRRSFHVPLPSSDARRAGDVNATRPAARLGRGAPARYPARRIGTRRRPPAPRHWRRQRM